MKHIISVDKKNCIGCKMCVEVLLNAIRKRRSIRKFKDRKVLDEVINNIIEAGRWTPTGKNSQGVSYIIIDKNKCKLEDMAVRLFKKLIKIIGIFQKSFRDMEIDDDFFFKKAPIAMEVVCNNDVDGSLAASNMALMAESYGLGVLYSGFFSFASRISPKLKRNLGVKKGRVVTTLVIGYPDVKYKRTLQIEKSKVIYK